MAYTVRTSIGSLVSTSDRQCGRRCAAVSLKPFPVRAVVAPVARFMGMSRTASKPYRSGVRQQSSYSVTKRSSTVRSRSSAVTVRAFRDTHRTEVLTSVAQEFAQAWGRAMVSGPTPEVMGALEKICDSRIEGIPKLQEKLGREFKVLHDYTSGNASMIDRSAEPRAVLLAADDGSDTAFCLMQIPIKKRATVKPQPGAAGEAGERTVNTANVTALEKGIKGITMQTVSDASRAACKPSTGMAQQQDQDYTYMVLKMDIMLDDTVRRVTSVVERGQLAEGFEPAMKLKMMEAAEQVQSVPGPVMTPFPHHLLQDWSRTRIEKGVRGPVVGPDAVEHVEEVQEAWVAARKSGTNIADMMSRAQVTNDFQMFDAYGMLPLICEAAATHYADETGHVCVLNKQQTIDMLQANKDTYNMDCHVVDSAVCLQKAAGFVHWKCDQKNKATDVTWQVEGMEVHMYQPETGGLRAVYLFGDAMDFEELQLFNRGLATAEA